MWEIPRGSSRALLDSPADWIAPGKSYRDNPPAAEGAKVILSDTDHLGGTPGSKDWVWPSFLRGLNTINYGLMALGTVDEKSIAHEEAARAMGNTRALANRVHLIAMTPRMTCSCIFTTGGLSVELTSSFIIGRGSHTKHRHKSEHAG